MRFVWKKNYDGKWKPNDGLTLIFKFILYCKGSEIGPPRE